MQTQTGAGFARVEITEQQVDLLIGHTLTALRKLAARGAPEGRRHRVRVALRHLHAAKRCADRPPIAWLYVNAAYWRLRTALLITAQ